MRLAEWVLLEGLGVFRQPENRFAHLNTAVKNLSESFRSSGRLDAEYYQSKYDRLLEQIRKRPHQKLGNLVSICKSVEPGSEAYRSEGLPFVRVSDLSVFGVSTPDKYLDENTFADAPHPKKDTILLTKDGTVGIAYKAEEDIQAVTSGAILHLNIKTDTVLPDYLTLLLNSPIVRLQAERDAGGSVIQHWKPSEIENVLIPLLSLEEQAAIADIVNQNKKYIILSLDSTPYPFPFYGLLYRFPSKSIRPLRTARQPQPNRTHLPHYQPNPLPMDCP